MGLLRRRLQGVSRLGLQPRLMPPSLRLPERMWSSSRSRRCGSCWNPRETRNINHKGHEVSRRTSVPRHFLRTTAYAVLLKLVESCGFRQRPFLDFTSFGTG